MGLAQSTTIDEFKNQIFGTVVALVAPHMDSELKFKQSEEIKDDMKHVLPMVVSGGNGSMDEVSKYYANYYQDGNIIHIDRYVQENIMNESPNHAIFLQMLIERLTKVALFASNNTTVENDDVKSNVVSSTDKQLQQQQAEEEAPDVVVSNEENEPEVVINEQQPEPSVRKTKKRKKKSKGSKVLDKKINDIMSAIDHEKFTSEQLMQNNLNNALDSASYKAEQPEDVDDDVGAASTIYGGPKSLHV